MDRYYEGCKEIEVDAVACDGEIIVQLVSEHVENAGVHSGDATIIFPAQDLQQETIRRVEDATAKIAKELNISGPLNAQFLCRNNGQELMVIETNVRYAFSIRLPCCETPYTMLTIQVHRDHSHSCLKSQASTSSN